MTYNVSSGTLNPTIHIRTDLCSIKALLANVVLYMVICPSIRLSVCQSVTRNIHKSVVFSQTKQFIAMVSIDS